MTAPQHDPNILDMHAELAAEALDGVAFQCAAAARFLRRGDDVAAAKTYERIVALHREFIAPELRVIRDAIQNRDTMNGEAAAASLIETEGVVETTPSSAAEWCADRDNSRKTPRAA